MATQKVILRGKVRYCKPWPGQLDTMFAFKDDGSPDPRGGNWSVDLAPDEDSQATLKALNTKAKIKEGYIKLRRYERHPKIGEFGPPVVTGVDEGVAIGNDSEAEIAVEIYDYGDRFGKRAIRWVSINVTKLVPYIKAEDQPRPAVAVPV